MGLCEWSPVHLHSKFQDNWGWLCIEVISLLNIYIYLLFYFSACSGGQRGHQRYPGSRIIDILSASIWVQETELGSSQRATSALISNLSQHFLSFLYLFVFLRWSFSRYSGTFYIDQAGIKFKDPPLPPECWD